MGGRREAGAMSLYGSRSVYALAFAATVAGQCDITQRTFVSRIQNVVNIKRRRDCANEEATSAMWNVARH